MIQGLAERQMDGILLSPINKGKEFGEFLLSLNIPIVCLGNVEGVAATAITELLAQIETENYAPKSIYLKYSILDGETL